MSIPKKGSRIVTVEGICYRWRIRHKPTYCESALNETWIIYAGDVALKKIVNNNLESLSLKDRLIYYLWVADYSMRNAGDLDTANDMHTMFQTEAANISNQLSLAFTYESFSLPAKSLEVQYFERFDSICNEIKNVQA
jgi:hypothetical protein